jgi:hypothetical protein
VVCFFQKAVGVLPVSNDERVSSLGMRPGWLALRVIDSLMPRAASGGYDASELSAATAWLIVLMCDPRLHQHAGIMCDGVMGFKLIHSVRELAANASAGFVYRV